MSNGEDILIVRHVWPARSRNLGRAGVVEVKYGNERPRSKLSAIAFERIVVLRVVITRAGWDEGRGQCSDVLPENRGRHRKSDRKTENGK